MLFNFKNLAALTCVTKSEVSGDNELNESSSHRERYLLKLSPGSSHYWALQQLKNEISSLSHDERERFSLLDIGCGPGFFGQELNKIGIRKCTGVDSDPGALTFAKEYYKKTYSSLPDLISDSAGGEHYSAIVFLDILEHLANPEEFLAEALKLVAPGGLVLISVPNIAHWYIRIMLLFGSFQYTERGILDRTHLRFFTVSSILELVSKTREQCLKNELIEISSAASIAPYEFLLPGYVKDSIFWRLLTKLRIRLAGQFPGLLGYQILVRCRKKANSES